MAEKDLESSMATDKAESVTISIKDEEPATPRSIVINPSNRAKQIAKSVEDEEPATPRSTSHLKAEPVTKSVKDEEPATPRSTVINPSNRAGQVVISVKDEEPLSTPNPSNTPLHCLASICLVLFVVLMSLLHKSKFRHKTPSPLKTDAFFVSMSLVALVVAGLTYLVLYINYRLRDHKIFYTILKSVCFFSGILAPLSLVFVLCVPHNLNWVAYLVICVLFVIVVSYNFIGCFKGFANKKLLDVSNLEDHQVIKERESNDSP